MLSSIFIVNHTLSLPDRDHISSASDLLPKYLFKLVYDQDKNRAWAHWQENSDATRATKPISYAELVKRTGIEFLPGLHPTD